MPRLVRPVPDRTEVVQLGDTLHSLDGKTYLLAAAVILLMQVPPAILAASTAATTSSTSCSHVEKKVRFDDMDLIDLTGR